MCVHCVVDCSDCKSVFFAFSEYCGDVLQIAQLYLYSNFSFKKKNKIYFFALLLFVRCVA